MNPIKSLIVAGLIMMLWPNIGTAQGWTDSGEYVHIPDTGTDSGPSAAQEMRDRQRFQWEKEDRQNRKEMQEKMETQAEDARREQAYAKDRAERRAKVERLRKAGGEKPFHSWQVDHQ